MLLYNLLILYFIEWFAYDRWCNYFGQIVFIKAFEGKEIINLSVQQNGQIKHF